jgi:NDP-sugar pyrophosphorylase family protein
MHAIIVGGQDAGHLRAFAADRPAALLPVVNRPLIEYVVEHLARHGVNEAAMCASPSLERHLGDGTRWGLAFRYATSLTDVFRSEAGAPPDAVVLASAAALSMADVGAAVALHRRRHAAMTVVVAPSAGSRQFGLDEEDRIVLGAAGSVAYDSVGLAVLDPRVIPPETVGLPDDLIERLVRGLITAGVRVHGVVTTEPSIVVRRLEDLRRANFAALNGGMPGLVLPGFEMRSGVRITRGAVVHRTARLIAPVVIGANAEIGRDAVVEGSVIGDDVIVGARSTIRKSVLFERTHVGCGLWVEGALVDCARICPAEADGWTTVNDRRLLGDTRAPLVRSAIAAMIRRRLGMPRGAAPQSAVAHRLSRARYTDAASGL